MFEYVMVLASIIIGLGLANLLQGVATLAQHPTRRKPYWVHLVWVTYAFVLTVFWWWWEFAFHAETGWTFELYLFVLGYAFVMYLMCAIVFPTDIDEYADYKDYFYSRRAWFFGIQILYLGIDVVDSALKGWSHLIGLGLEYWITTPLQAVLSAVAIFWRNERFHAIFAVAMLIYQVSWALRQFGAMN